MSANSQIVGYFLEEAKEHLETIEQGLLDLQSTMKDQESLNELFRAAHSVKGGAAMLGFSSVQKTAHRLEDSFKVLKENPKIAVDHKLENLFLSGFDVLQDLLERVQGPFGLRDEEAKQILDEAEPRFLQLQAHLESLDSGGPGIAEEVAPPPAKKAPTPGATPVSTSSDFPHQVTRVLREMLQVFKQKTTPTNRQQLEEICSGLLNLDEQSSEWIALVETAQTAISNPKASYETLAPLVIKELKIAAELVNVGRTQEVKPSSELAQLAESAMAKRVAITLEPEAAAKILMVSFDQKQLKQLIATLKQGAA
ncbi:Hpt domain-containing protein [Roseofilum capinflatum]|uniref:Hpt domain-containing protein n=1 Tax=Roseofilum capinflatum BLCC-M114 TaxID=3022440 RepID=A0ABT7B9L6_9CYAN|nr:Hpt domain-containing protein [Roseofilum capinflatum]MDJ1175855.1 Hpt domain-containing protein [Roseofilum capinflatum BLCC-M114]